MYNLSEQQSTTENQLFVESRGQLSELSETQRIANYWFYITVNNLCKQL